MKLYYMPGACSLAPHIVLEWLGVEYELEKVNRGDPHYLKVNALGMVPALIDGDSEVITQASAILKYLSNQYPQTQLGDDGSIKGKYELDHWLAFLTGDFHPAFWPFFAPQRFTTDTSEAQIKIIKEAAYLRIDRVLTYLDTHLAGKQHVVGNRRTIADPYAFTMSRWAEKLPKPLSEYKNLSKFMNEMKQDAGVQTALKKQGLEI